MATNFINIHFYKGRNEFPVIIRPTTKELLAASLQELSQSKSIDKITVKEISQNCQLTATTFYNHFQDKYALVAWIFHKEITPLYDRLGTEYDWNTLLTKALQAVYKNRHFYRNALKNTSGQSSFQKAATDYFIDRMNTYICRQQGTDELSEELHFMIRFYVVGVVYLTSEWVMREDKLPSDGLIRLLEKAMPEKLRPYLCCEM